MVFLLRAVQRGATLQLRDRTATAKNANEKAVMTPPPAAVKPIAVRVAIGFIYGRDFWIWISTGISWRDEKPSFSKIETEFPD
jgi:hypothetical protein